MGDWAAVGVAVLLLAGNAFFVGAEFSLVSARRTRIEPRVQDGSGRARIALRAMERVSLMMAGAQLGITVCSLGLGAVGEPAVAHLLEPVFELFGVPDAVVHPISFAIALTVVVTFHMVVGEMVPKNFALVDPERAAMILGPPLYALVWLLRPIISLLNWAANTVLRLLRVQPQEEVSSTYTADEVADFLSESRQEGWLDDDEMTLLTGALGFTDTPAREIAVPVADLVTVPEDVSVQRLEDLCGQMSFSRFTVEDGTGAPRGYVHLKDVLGASSDQHERPVPSEWVRPLITVGVGDPLDKTLASMQAHGAHMARLAQDDGDVLGVVFLEDVLEELVGEVVDHGAG